MATNDEQPFGWLTLWGRIDQMKIDGGRRNALRWPFWCRRRRPLCQWGSAATSDQTLLWWTTEPRKKDPSAAEERQVLKSHLLPLKKGRAEGLRRGRQRSWRRVGRGRAVDGGGGMWASSAAWQEWKVGDWLLCKSITTTPEGWYIRAGWPPRSQSPPLALAGDQRKQVCLFCSARLLLFRKALYLQVCLSFIANGALKSGISLKMSDQHEDEGILGYTAARQRPQIIQGWNYFVETPFSNILPKWLKWSCQHCGITAR